MDLFHGLHGQRPTRRDCRRIKSFIKLESYPEFKEARWINSRADIFKAWSGRFFRTVEEVLYDNPWFIKHVPIPSRPALVRSLRKAGLFYYENDYKSFEASIIPDLMRVCECQLYTHVLQRQPDDAAFINSVLLGRNELRTRAKVKTSIRGRRMSGDMCTSCGNGFTNLMLVLYVVSLKGGFVNGFVEGDDGLFASTVQLSSDDFTRCGMTVEIHEVSDPCRAHFCGMTFADTGVCIKDPRRVFQNFGWTHSFINAGPRIMDELLRSKALSLWYEMAQCPIVGQLAFTALGLTDGVDLCHYEDTTERGYDVRDLGKLTDFGVFRPDSQTRDLFASLYGISVNDQLYVEALIRNHRLDQIQSIIPANLSNQVYCTRYIEVG